MAKVLKSGAGWRLGWHPEAREYQGLVGSDDWAIELTEAEWQDFCRLFKQLAENMEYMANELMDEEKITCEAVSDLLWMEATGYPDSYSVQFILNNGRRCEGKWPSIVVANLLQAIESINVF